jgi:NitT/TauT family transport system permease protein
MLGINSGFGEPLHPGWPRATGASSSAGISKVFQSPLVQANGVSAIRLVEGFIVSLILGAALGALIWRWEFFDNLLGPVFLGLQTLPSVCWVPLAILLFSFSESAFLFVVVMGSAFGIAVAMRDGLRTIPPLYRRAGLMMGASGWRLYRYVLFPASLPALASSLRSGFSFAWRSLMGAELILTATEHRGLGFLLNQGRDTEVVAQVVAVMIVMIVIGMLADQFAFAPLERRIHARFGLAVG